MGAPDTVFGLFQGVGDMDSRATVPSSSMLDLGRHYGDRT
jgi:hypothetical protein